MAHKDFRIQFELDGRYYEAVGFLTKYEPLIDGAEMIRRTASENGGAISNTDDYLFIRERRQQLPTALNQFTLVTNVPFVDNSSAAACFRCDGNWWSVCAGWFGNQHGAKHLVLRRLP